MRQTKKQHWLRQLRDKANITQEDLAARLQVEGWATTRASVNNWENGNNDAPLKDPVFRQALSRALKIDIKSILKMAGYEVDTEHTPRAEQAASIIDRLPEDKQELALRLIEQLSKA